MDRKDVALKIRVPRELREEFLEACRCADRPAAAVLRDFMQDYIESRQHGRQQSLLPENNKHKRGRDRGHG